MTNELKPARKQVRRNHALLDRLGPYMLSKAPTKTVNGYAALGKVDISISRDDAMTRLQQNEKTTYKEELEIYIVMRWDTNLQNHSY